MKSTVDIFVASFAYGGNGGVSMQLPILGDWWAKTYHEMMSDDRIGRLKKQTFADTPITMTRNEAVKIAEQEGFDFILMLDSDNHPDLYLGRSVHAKPFWKSSFDFAYERLLAGLPTAIFAPYCGPPPHPVGGGEEVIYAFDWEQYESDDAHSGFHLRMPSRTDAARRVGIHPAGAGPTGVILYSLTAQKLIGHPKYKYEWSDKTESQKDTTEDCYNTREISLAGWLKHKTDVLFCNWDAWAGHHKPKVVGKPVVTTIDSISEHFKQAVKDNVQSGERIMRVDFTKNAEEPARPSRAASNGIAKNGVPMPHRMVAGNAVVSVGHQTAAHELETLTAMTELLAQSRRDKALRVVEVGSWVGESALAIEAGFGRAGGTVFCVDHFQGSPNDHTSEIVDRIEGSLFDHFKRNVGDKLGTSIRVIQDFSVDAAASLPPQEADMIFLDAGHEYEEIKADIEAWLPHVAKDGILCGHDYDILDVETNTSRFPGVKQAVQEVFAGCQVVRPEGTSLWVIKMHEYWSKNTPSLAGSSTP